MRPLLVSAFLASAASLSASGSLSSDLKPAVIVSTAAEPIAPGKFLPTWQSLSQYEVPEWFRDRKFGGLPSGPVALKSLGTTAALLDRTIAKVEQLGVTETLVWSLGADALTVTPASVKPASDAAIVFKVTLK